MKTLVISVIYSGVEKYLSDYFSSLNNQTSNDFDVLIIEDGISLPKEFLQNNIIVQKSPAGKTPSDIRWDAIKFAESINYDIIIFADADDYFSLNRVEQTVSSLKDVDICVNEIIPVSENGQRINQNNSFVLPPSVDITEMFNANYFGMTNTAVKISSLPKDFYIPSNIIAADWWLFTLLLLHGRKYVFDREMITYYRQHENNTIGVNAALSENKVWLGIQVKLIHYDNLLDYCNKFGLAKYSPLITELIKEFNELEIKLRNENFMKEYITVIKNNIDRIKTGWWSEFISLNELREYREYEFSENRSLGLK